MSILHAPLAQDETGLLALNNIHAVETSALTAAQLRALIAISFRTRIVRPANALCIALDQSAAYASANFLWFRERYPHFVYVDRVIVAAHARGRGLARELYADLMEAARDAGHSTLCCEVNTYPANPVSQAFHDSLGFVEAGTAELAERSKKVRYLARDL